MQRSFANRLCWCVTAGLVLGVSLLAWVRADDALLLRDSIVDNQAHNFPVVSYSVATVHGVTFQQEGIVTYKGWQYAAYYQGNSQNSTGKVAVARRRLPDGAWQSLVFNDYAFTSTDSHNDVVLGICPGDGSIHLSFDHHVSTLHYRFSRAGLADRPDEMSWDATQFGAVLDRLIPTTAAMTQVTYPRFIATPAGKLLFSYRYGSSGGGDEMLLEYNGVTRSWSNLGQYTTRAGSYTGSLGTGTDRNAYFDDTVFDDQGRLHATWCWRETPDGGSNHDLNYAYSDDAGRTWKNNLGTTVATTGSSFLAINSPGVLAWSIPQKRNYINNSAMTVDKQGRVHVVAWMLPAAAADQATFTTSLTSASRFIHYWRGLDGVWRRNETTFTGTRAKLLADADGRLFLVYGDTTNLRVLAATPASNPEQNPAASWSDWASLQLSAALPAGRANTVNMILDRSRWIRDRVISVYAQETNVTGTAPTPLHVLDYHVSRAAVMPSPAIETVVSNRSPTLSWVSGQKALMHDVYFGTDAAAVMSARPNSPEYRGRVTSPQFAVTALTEASFYYWRVDAIDTAGRITTGQLWSFATSDLLPRVSAISALRHYGGGVDFVCNVAVTDVSLTSAQLELFIGTSDAATDATGWDRRIDLGPKPSGTHSVSADALPLGTLYYRYRVTTLHGSTWSVSTAQVSGEDLAEWRYSAVLQVTGLTAGENLTNFPLLLRLSPQMMTNFAYAQLRSAAAGDLRFSNLAGDQIYDYEIESWNPTGTSHVWVKIPQLVNGSALRMWWGCAAKTSPNSKPTWSADYSGVWHLDSARGYTVDSSPSGLVGTASNLASASTAVSAGAAGLNGSSSAMEVANAAALNPADLTLEAWVKTSSTTQMSIFSRDLTTVASPQRAWQFRLTSGKPEVIFFNNSTNNNALSSATAISDNQFHHVATTWDGTTIRLYVDGVLKNSAAFAGPLRSNLTNSAFIGRSQNLSANFFNGSIDEVRLSSVARSAGWLQACWNNQRVGSSMVTSSAAAGADLDADGLVDAWEMQYFSSIAAAGAQAQLDADADGLVNWVEQALALNPTLPDAASALSLPRKVGNAWLVNYQRSALAATDCVVEASTDLTPNSWSSAPVSLQRLSTGEPELWQASCVSAAPQLFFRLRLQR